MRPLHEDSRGLATGIIAFVGMLIVFALLYTLMDSGAVMVFDMTAGQASSTTAQDAIAELRQIWDVLPMFGVFLALVFLLGRAVFESRGA